MEAKHLEQSGHTIHERNLSQWRHTNSHDTLNVANNAQGLTQSLAKR